MVDSISTTNKNAAIDPYKAHNYEDLPLDQKINDLVTFVQGIKYGMLTTKLSSDSDLLASRCMALAGQVCISIPASNEIRRNLTSQ